MTINNGQPKPLICIYFYSLNLFIFRILALENIAKILMTGPRLKSALYGTNCPNMNPFYLMVGKISALVRELVLYFFIYYMCVS